MVNALYHSGSVEEEAIMIWHAKKAPADSCKKRLQDVLDPFVQWLEEAEEEDDEEED